MGISSALYSGISGLHTNGRAMTVLGNNLANTNTIGYKGSRSVFSDLLAGNITGSGGRSQVGRGVNMSSVDQIFSQGTFDTTESNLDMAIEGEGFFIVSPPDDQNNYYTRAGAFRFDGEGFLVNAEGYRVQGRKFNDEGDILPGDPADIQLENRGLVAGKISDEITLNTNLDSRAELKDPANFNPNDPASYNYASSVEIFDSLGVSHVVTTYFLRSENNVGANPGDPSTSTWQVAWTANDVNGNPLGNLEDKDGDGVEETPINWLQPGVHANGVTTENLTFDATGQLIDPDPGTEEREETFLTLPEAALQWGNGSAVENVKVKFAATQFSSDSSVLSIDQNGFGAGSMTNVEVDSTGTLFANYSNGKRQQISQLALGKFANPNGLEQMGGNIFAATLESGPPRVGIPDKELGRVYTNSLEKSNVDMGNEMVQMITVQRGYSANSKIISTVDEMMQEVINLKR